MVLGDGQSKLRFNNLHGVRRHRFRLLDRDGAVISSDHSRQSVGGGFTSSRLSITSLRVGQVFVNPTE